MPLYDPSTWNIKPPPEFNGLHKNSAKKYPKSLDWGIPQISVFPYNEQEEDYETEEDDRENEWDYDEDELKDEGKQGEDGEYESLDETDEDEDGEESSEQDGEESERIQDTDNHELTDDYEKYQPGVWDDYKTPEYVQYKPTDFTKYFELDGWDRFERYHFDNATQAAYFAEYLWDHKTIYDSTTGYGYSNRREHYYKTQDEKNVQQEWHDGLRMMKEGDETIVTEAEKLVDQFLEQIHVPRIHWERGIMGYVPNVPAMLLSQPKTMMYKRPDPVDHSPIRIWVGVTSTWDVSRSQIFTRGAALAAFAIALSQRRPVKITPFWQMYYGPAWGPNKREAVFVSWDLSTSPMVLSELCNLGNPEITRYVGTTVCQLLCRKELHMIPYVIQDQGDYRYNPDTGKREYTIKAEDIYRELLGAKQEDMVFGAADSWNSQMMDDPVGWIKDQIKRYVGEDTEDAYE